jgi:hypothetical protein
MYDKYYTNQVVGTDTQSADALINIIGLMNLTRDPEAPSPIQPNQKAVKLGPEVQRLEDQRAQL